MTRYRLFGVGYAVSGCHQVNLFWADHLSTAEAVPVHDFAFEHPSKGLQSNVWMLADV